MQDPRSARDPLAEAREGMHVVDAGGNRIGEVEIVQAPAESENDTGSAGGTEPDIEPDLAHRLVRTGYLKLRGRNLLHRNRYIGAEQVNRIEGGTIHVAVTESDLPTRRPHS